MLAIHSSDRAQAHTSEQASLQLQVLMGRQSVMVKPGCYCQVVSMNVILHSRAELKGDYKRLGFEIVAIKGLSVGRTEEKTHQAAKHLVEFIQLVPHSPM